jgi:serine/threonine protein kinase
LHLHQTNIIHRDLACRNLLVDDKMDVFVADFGFARLKRMQESKGFTLTGLGPVRWEAPESLQHKGNDTIGGWVDNNMGEWIIS